MFTVDVYSILIACVSMSSVSCSISKLDDNPVSGLTHLASLSEVLMKGVIVSGLLPGQLKVLPTITRRLIQVYLCRQVYLQPVTRRVHHNAGHNKCRLLCQKLLGSPGKYVLHLD